MHHRRRRRCSRAGTCGWPGGVGSRRGARLSTTKPASRHSHSLPRERDLVQGTGTCGARSGTRRARPRRRLLLQSRTAARGLTLVAPLQGEEKGGEREHRAERVRCGSFQGDRLCPLGSGGFIIRVRVTRKATRCSKFFVWSFVHVPMTLTVGPESEHAYVASDQRSGLHCTGGVH